MLFFLCFFSNSLTRVLEKRQIARVPSTPYSLPVVDDKTCNIAIARSRSARKALRRRVFHVPLSPTMMVSLSLNYRDIFRGVTHHTQGK